MAAPRGGMVTASGEGQLYGEHCSVSIFGGSLVSLVFFGCGFLLGEIVMEQGDSGRNKKSPALFDEPGQGRSQGGRIWDIEIRRANHFESLRVNQFQVTRRSQAEPGLQEAADFP